MKSIKFLEFLEFSGKSTCLSLLQRFYNPVEGDIFIDDHDIKSLNINALRSTIATVSQEPVLFSTTIEENIRYGNPSASYQEIVSAAVHSGADVFIKTLPDGYKTMVGDRGSQLSGGQKQRIAIARALIQNPRILLLDEATSALDYQSEKYVQKALDNLSHGRTTIVVSHRLSAIRSADRIVFLEKGQVVEDGTHNQLLQMKGRYYELVKSHAIDDETSSGTDESDQIALNRQLSSHASNEMPLRRTFSITSSDSINSDEEEVEPIQYWTIFKRIVRLVKPNWLSLCCAIMASLLLGSTLPLFSVLFAEILGVNIIGTF